jgi:hypothetical protein
MKKRKINVKIQDYLRNIKIYENLVEVIEKDIKNFDSNQTKKSKIKNK